MRLIGIGLLAFVLAGIALFLTNSETLRLGVRTLSEVALGPRLTFETTIQPKAASKSGAVVYRTGPSVPLILSGFPAYQSAAFLMPVDARPTSGYLQINATVQALAGIEGVLRVSIGNSKRAELLLRPGEAGRSLRIQLTDQDIAREQLVVSFSLQGQGPHTPCGIDEGVETIVEIETTSAIFLELDTPLVSHRDQALVSGRSVTLALSANEPAPSLLAGRELLKSGITPQYAAVGWSAAQAVDVSREFAVGPHTPRFPWSDTLEERAHLFGLRKFHRSQTWRLRYDLSHATEPRLPERFNLRMVLGRLQANEQWQIVVTLNGRHLDDRLVTAGKLELDIPLPGDAPRRHNVIEVTANAAHISREVCDRGPELFAEVVQGTDLLPGPQIFRDTLSDLTERMQLDWSLTSAPLSFAEASVATELLFALPSPSRIDRGDVLVHVLPRGAELLEWANSQREVWILAFDDEGRIALTALDEMRVPIAPRVSLLIALGGAGS